MKKKKKRQKRAKKKERKGWRKMAENPIIKLLR